MRWRRRGARSRRGDGDAGEATKSLGMRPTGLRRTQCVELTGSGHVGALWAPRCCDRQPVRAPWPPWQGFMRMKLEAPECEWMRPCDSESELVDKDAKEGKKERKKTKEKILYVFSLINCVLLALTLIKIA